MVLGNRPDGGGTPVNEEGPAGKAGPWEGGGWSPNWDEVDEMVVLIGGEYLLEEVKDVDLLSGGELPVGHVKSCFSQLLEEGVLGGIILPGDLMGACLNMHICCPGGEGRLVIFLDVVYLGHSEGVVLGVGVEPAGESDILYSGLG